MESIDHFVHVCVVGRGHFVKGTFVGGGDLCTGLLAYVQAGFSHRFSKCPGNPTRINRKISLYRPTLYSAVMFLVNDAGIAASNSKVQTVTIVNNEVSQYLDLVSLNYVRAASRSTVHF